MSLHGPGLRERGQQALAGVLGVLTRERSRNHERELVAAQAGKQFTFSERGAKTPRHLLEQQVTRRVTERIVDGLEVV